MSQVFPLRLSVPMLRDLLIVVAIVALPVASHAQDLPRVDPPGLCRQRWTKGGVLDNEMYAYCLNQEQTAYDGLKLTWPSMSANVRSTCASRWGKPVDGSYEMLQYCANEQTKAERQNSSSTFRY